MAIKPTTIQMVDLKSQYLRIEEEVQEGWQEVVQSGAFINGPAVKGFTADLAEYLNATAVIPCANGTDALQIALMALDLKPGDEIITVPFTFVATAEVAALLGLKIRFVDIEANSFCMDPSALEAAIGPETKCIVPVHLFGQTANMEAIMAIANKLEIPVVEDNAQAIGASCLLNGEWQKAGTIGTTGTTSFYPSKNLGAYGDGGAIFTNDEVIAGKIRSIANHGQSRKYMSDLIGVNSRLDSLQAVVLAAKLRLLDEFNEERKAVASFYDKAFASDDRFTIPWRAPWSEHVFHQYCLIYSGDRDALRERLSEAGIPSMIYYPHPIHLMPAYKEFGNGEGSFPVSEQMAKQTIALPIHTEMDEETLGYICEQVLLG